MGVVAGTLLTGCSAIVLTAPPGGVTETTAEFRGLAWITEGGPGVYWFGYERLADGAPDPPPTYLFKRTPERTLERSDEPNAVSETATGLVPGSRYYYLLCATNDRHPNPGTYCSTRGEVRTAGEAPEPSLGFEALCVTDDRGDWEGGQFHGLYFPWNPTPAVRWDLGGQIVRVRSLAFSRNIDGSLHDQDVVVRDLAYVSATVFGDANDNDQLDPGEPVYASDRVEDPCPEGGPT